MNQPFYPELPILIVDDEKSYLDSIGDILTANELTNVKKCQDSMEVMPRLQENDFSVIILDLKMPYISGEELLPKILEEYPHIDIIVVTGKKEIETSVECMKKGAFDYLIKPFDNTRLVNTVKHALDLQKEKNEKKRLKKKVLSGKLENPNYFEDFITDNAGIKNKFKYIEAVAASTEPVLITGATGVGKGLIARAIHKASQMKGKIISENIAGLDDHLFSDTIFGRIKGAFTGADKDRKGRVENAKDGTLFLDEIGDLSAKSQVKLLRLLQEKEYYPLGSDTVKRTNARIIAATNQDLPAKIKSGEFRKDLYYRLKCHQIHIPPLKERKEDLPVLIGHFLKKKESNLETKEAEILKEKLVTLFSNYDFPGNIRELESMVYDSLSKYKAGILSVEVDETGAEKKISGNNPSNKAIQDSPGNSSDWGESDITSNPNFIDLKKVYKEIKKDYEIKKKAVIEKALKRADNNKTVAAELLGIPRNTLNNILKRIIENDMQSNGKEGSH